MILITYEPIDAQGVTTTVLDASNGGVVTFMGTTRAETEGRRVFFLEYEGYEEMAQRQLILIADTAKEQFGVRKVAIAHRLGHLNIGEVSLVVAVGSIHRREAFAACQWIVDQIKQKVPIWKKEAFDEGQEWVNYDAEMQ